LNASERQKRDFLQLVCAVAKFLSRFRSAFLFLANVILGKEIFGMRQGFELEIVAYRKYFSIAKTTREKKQ
jgi:hypothetical protein